MIDPTIPAISVCIPTFNGERTIAETLRSVLGQTFTDFEIVICDDSSTDGTLTILSEINDDRIKIHRFEKASAASENWNRAMHLCQSEFIKIMGQDDVLYPNCLEIELRALSTHEAQLPTFVYSRRDIVLHNGFRLKRSNLLGRKGSTVPSTPKLIRRVIRSGRNPIGEPVAITMRRSAYEKTRGFHGSYVIDLDMWFQLLEFGPAVKVEEVLSAFRVSRKSWSFQLRKTQAAETISLLQTASQKYCDRNSSLHLRIGTLMAYAMQFARMIVLSSIGSSRRS
jgi:glycosyltransferase involved in cell wall biosynthesis